MPICLQKVDPMKKIIAVQNSHYEKLNQLEKLLTQLIAKNTDDGDDDRSSKTIPQEIEKIPRTTTIKELSNEGNLPGYSAL